MLSPHEIATLMLLRDRPDPLQLDPIDLEALIRHDLVRVEPLRQGPAFPRLTRRGRTFLEAFAGFAREPAGLPGRFS